MSYLNLINLDVFFLGIAIAFIGILGFVVFLNNRKSITNWTFMLFAILTISWSGMNFFVSRLDSSDLVLWFLRISIFLAVWHAFSFFQLFYVFPREKLTFPIPYKFILFPIVLFTSLLTLTPLVFVRTNEFSATGQVTSVINGLGIFVFGIVVMGCILGGLILMLKKTIGASAIEKIQFRYILIGSAITFFLLIIFNFILPAFFDNARFVPLGALFILPFAIFTSYAIIRHHLLRIKVVATEILTFVLAIASLVEVIISEDVGIFIFRISTFLLLLIFGILLIRSVRKEVDQKEELAKVASQLKEANVELEKLDKAKSEFLSIASHQLRTPLTAIKGYISLFLEGSYGIIPEEAKKRLKNVYEANERLINLINDLLNLSRIESGKIDMQWEDVDVKEVSQSVAQELEIKAKEKNLQLQIIAEQPIHMRADKAKLRNIIMNIVDNAIRYTEKGGITVILKKLSTPAIRIEVSDTGAGMTQEELQHIFQKFTRGQAGNTMFAGGSGLGLNIAKEFVQLHKGKIWAESQGKDKGSVFIIELPLMQAQHPTL